MDIKPLKGIGIEPLHAAFARAFADYVVPFNQTSQQLKYMLERRGCDLNLSFGTFEAEELVGFTLNCIGDWGGKLTAYNTGTGVIPAFRKKGIVQEMFKASLPILRASNVSRCLLEVIRSNTPALKLYQKIGYTASREIDCYISPQAQLQIDTSKAKDLFQIEEINNPDWNQIKTFCDFEPSWQNSIDSIKRKIQNFKLLGVFIKGVLVGYGAVENVSGDIPQFAIARPYRRRGLATALFNRLVGVSSSTEVKVINADASYKPLEQFAASISLSPIIGQYEMKLELEHGH